MYVDPAIFHNVWNVDYDGNNDVLCATYFYRIEVFNYLQVGCRITHHPPCFLVERSHLSICLIKVGHFCNNPLHLFGCVAEHIVIFLAFRTTDYKEHESKDSDQDFHREAPKLRE